jgi:integrase
MSMKQINPGTWLLDIRVWRDGKEYRRREEFQGGKKAATARSTEIRKELQERAAKEEPRSLTVADFSTFNEVLDFYLQNNDLSKSRAESYFKRLRSIGATPLENLSKVFKEFIRIEREGHSLRTGEYLTVASVNKLKVFANAALNFAVKEERIKENPLRGVSKEKETPRWVTLTLENEKKLLEAVKAVSPAIVPFIDYAVDVPCRKGEMLRAGRECFDAFSNTITLPGSLTKNGRPCTKPVPASLVQYFRSNPSPWLFYREEKGEYKPLGFIQKAWERAVKVAGLNEMRDQEGKPIGALRLHDLRHHAVSKLIAAGNPRSYVIAVAGWSNDMLSIYWNTPEKEIAQSIVFQRKPDTSTGHFEQVLPKIAQI